MRSSLASDGGGWPRYIRVAFRQLGGEPEASPLTPPWFLPGAEEVWQRISETERALRAVVREVYVARVRRRGRASN